MSYWLDTVRPSKLHLLITLPIILAVMPSTYGQQMGAVTTASASVTEGPFSTASIGLPDAPSALLSSSSHTEDEEPQEPQPGQPSTSIKPASVEHRWFGLGNGDAQRASHMASKTDKFILPGQLAPKLDTSDKIVFGAVQGISAYSILGWFTSAGYSHVINGSPNYGSDKGAFGERLGAAALHGYSEDIFKDALMANVLHQDPRYYKMGPSHNVFARTAYSVSRVLVTRNDGGQLGPNYSLITGNLLSAALTNAYYPEVNRGFGQTARTFGSSMYGSAFGFFASEFLSGALEAIHLKGNRN